MRLVHEYENNKKSKEYNLIKSRLSKGLLLKSFGETKEELKRKNKEEEKFKKGLRKDKYNDYWYGAIKVKKNNKFIEMFRIDRLNEILELSEELKKAYTLKDELRKWIRLCEESEIPEMVDAAKTINNWLNEVVNLFIDERYSNGFTEANNNTNDKIVDRAYGYKNFEFFRKRVLVILHQSYSIKKEKNVN